MLGFAITIIVIILLVAGVLAFVFMQYRRILREAKNYERGLKMVPLYIHIPPISSDIEGNGRDERDLAVLGQDLHGAGDDSTQVDRLAKGEGRLRGNADDVMRPARPGAIEQLLPIRRPQRLGTGAVVL